MAEEEKILEVTDLKKYYKDVKAVDGVSLFIYRGQVVSVLGPNGAGKTTTIEIIEGLRTKDSGAIKLFGEVVQSIDSAEKERIGVQLQETNFFPHLTVVETIELFRSFFSKTISTERALQIAMLEEKRKAYVEKLSGGQKQRLALALALVNDPEIVFLDEPTTGLDPQARRGVWDTIKQLQQEGKTIILTTHYMEEAEELSDYIFIMDHGQVIQQGTVHDLVNSLQMQSLVEFEVTDAAANDIVKRWTDLQVRMIEGGHFSIETTDFMNTLSILSGLSKRDNIPLKDIMVRQPNLEDVFLHLTGRTLRE
jgi:ABC-2 type transport system ATP-binding protein